MCSIGSQIVRVAKERIDAVARNATTFELWQALIAIPFVRVTYVIIFGQ
jgi:hypothetical protein